MDIRVLGWRYQNIRGGLRDLEIDLGDPVPRWTLVQMPNGTGKTTTMALFRAVLAGESLSPQAISDLRPSDDVAEGLFELRLSLDERPIRLQLRLDYRDGICSYWTARAGVRSGGLEEGRLLPGDFARLLSPDFVRLFVFDGELAKEIRTVGKERAAEAIRTLYRLDRLDDLRRQAARLVEEEQQRAARVSSATELKGIRRWQNAVSGLRAKKDQLARHSREQQKRRKALEDRRDALAGQISVRIEQDGALRKRKEALDHERSEIDRAIHEATAQGLGILRSPAKLHPRILERLHALGGRLSTLKLPKTISHEFFQELAVQPVCVCGRPITTAERRAILDGAAQYLAEDQIGVLNRMKLALKESAADATEFSVVAIALGEHLRNLRKNKAAHDRLELERIESGDTEVERFRTEIENIRIELAGLETEIERITTKDASRQRALGANENSSLPLCDAELRRCQEKLATATKTRRFTLQAERVQQLVGEVSGSALELLRERVRTSTNGKLARLIPSERIHVARIGGALELGSGRLAAKGGVSEGQSLAVAYAFLTSLLADAPYKLPLVVDSPAVSLDTRVRREVGELIPTLFGQMIMFVISSEREGFADAFYARRGVRFLTVWREGEDRTQMREGLRFFRDFHALEAAE